MRLSLNQAATHWIATPNGFGGYDFGTPTVIKCRWEEKAELIPGSIEMSHAVVYVDRDMSPEDYLILGESTSITPSTDHANRIKSFKKVPDLRNLESLKKVWL